MVFLKILAFVWLLLMLLTFLGIVIGHFMEKKISDDTQLKKWWRKNIVAPDPDDENRWKNFNG